MYSPATARLIHKMYIAHFGRPADPLGLRHWAAWHEKNNDLELMRQHFSASDEWREFCSGSGTKQLVKKLFKRMFDRRVDRAGLRYFLSLDPQNNAELSGVASKIADGAVGIDLFILEKKISNAIEFCDNVEERDKLYDGNSINSARKFLARVDANIDDTAIERHSRKLIDSLPDRVVNRATEKTKKLFLHIGSDKTGSSAIQHHMHKNSGWLAQRGVFVPPLFLNHINGHASLFQHLCRDNLRDFVQEIDASPLTSALVSWEGIHAYQLKDIKLLSEYINRYELVIIFYVREQAEIIQTGALQTLKHEKQAFDILTKQLNDMPAGRDYDKLVAAWEQVFPTAEFKLSVYDRGQLKGGDVVEDFFHQLGRPVDGEFLRTDAVINPSLDFYTAQVLLMLESTCEFEQYERVEIVNSLLEFNEKSTSNEKYFYNEKQVTRIREHYCKSNKRLLDRFQRSVDSLVPKKISWRSNVPHSEVIGRISSIFDHLEGDFIRSILPHGKVYDQQLTAILALGWYPVGHQIAWSKSDRSVIKIQLDDSQQISDQDVVLLMISGNYALTVVPLTEVYIEEKHLGNYDLSKAKIKIPQEELTGRTSIEITLVHPKAVVPAEIGINKDSRLIAYALRSFDIGVSGLTQRKS